MARHRGTGVQKGGARLRKGGGARGSVRRVWVLAKGVWEGKGGCGRVRKAGSRVWGGCWGGKGCEGQGGGVRARGVRAGMGCLGAPEHGAWCGVPGLPPAPSLGQFGGAAALGGAPPPCSRGPEPPRSDGSRCGHQQLQAWGGLQPFLSHPVLGESCPKRRRGGPEIPPPHPCTPRGSRTVVPHCTEQNTRGCGADVPAHIPPGAGITQGIPWGPLGDPLGTPLLPPPPRMRMPWGWPCPVGAGRFARRRLYVWGAFSSRPRDRGSCFSSRLPFPWPRQLAWSHGPGQLLPAPHRAVGTTGHPQNTAPCPTEGIGASRGERSGDDA